MRSLQRLAGDPARKNGTENSNSLRRHFREVDQLVTVGGSSIAAIGLDDTNVHHYWTRHPQGWKDRWKAEDPIAKDFDAFFSIKRQRAGEKI
jgi:hypothetical protein